MICKNCGNAIKPFEFSLTGLCPECRKNKQCVANNITKTNPKIFPYSITAIFLKLIGCIEITVAIFLALCLTLGISETLSVLIPSAVINKIDNTNILMSALIGIIFGLVWVIPGFLLVGFGEIVQAAYRYNKNI